MEIVFRIIAWTLQIGITLLIACTLSTIIIVLLKMIGKKNLKRTYFVSVISSMILLSIVIIYIANNPFIRCPPEYENLMTKKIKKDVIEYNKGFYSYNIPVFPVTIDVLHVEGKNVIVQTNYLYIGTTQMEIIDGQPSIVKPLN